MPKKKTKGRRRGRPRLKQLDFGSSYPMKGKMPGGGPYFITRQAPAQAPIIVQMPPQKTTGEEQREKWKAQAERREMFAQIEREGKRRIQDQAVAQTKSELGRKDTMAAATKQAKEKMKARVLVETKKSLARKDVLAGLENKAKQSELDKQENKDWVVAQKGRRARNALLGEIASISPMETITKADEIHEQKLGLHTQLKQASAELATVQVEDAPMADVQPPPAQLAGGFTIGQGGPRTSTRKLGGGLTDWVKSSPEWFQFKPVEPDVPVDIKSDPISHIELPAKRQPREKLKTESKTGRVNLNKAKAKRAKAAGNEMKL